MDNAIFGYYIEPDVFLDVKKRMLVNTNVSKKAYHRQSVSLRETMFQLLLFLLKNANGSIIRNSDILINVWDEAGLSSSNQRLWQVMHGLKIKLNAVGISEDFIMRVDSKGYYIKKDMITILYRREKSLCV